MVGPKETRHSSSLRPYAYEIMKIQLYLYNDDTKLPNTKHAQRNTDQVLKHKHENKILQLTSCK